MTAMKDSRVLVTGGTGFVAGWCIVELLRRGHAVRTTVRSLSKESAVRAAVASAGVSCDRLSFAVADLTDEEGWDAAVAGCAYVLHVASPLSLGGGSSVDRDSWIGPARDGTLRVLRAADNAGVMRVVMTSAAAAARPPLDSGLVSDERQWADPADPQFDNYRVSKILAERAAWDFMEQTSGSMEFATILPGAVFGPILTPAHSGSMGIIKDLLQGRPKALPRLGFWVVDVRDLADLHVRAMTSPEAAGQRFLAAGEFLWMEEIAQILRDHLGERAARVPKRRLPAFVVRLLLPFLPRLKGVAPLLGRKFPLASEKARRVLAFCPRSARETIVDCAQSP